MRSKCETCKHCSFFQIRLCPPIEDKEVEIFCSKYDIELNSIIKKCIGHEKKKLPLIGFNRKEEKA